MKTLPKNKENKDNNPKQETKNITRLKEEKKRVVLLP